MTEVFNRNPRRANPWSAPQLALAAFNKLPRRWLSLYSFRDIRECHVHASRVLEGVRGDRQSVAFDLEGALRRRPGPELMPRTVVSLCDGVALRLERRTSSGH